MKHKPLSPTSLSRRKFLSAALAAGTAIPAAAAFLRPARAASRGKGPNEKLNLAVVGLGGQGLYDLREASMENSVPTENIVAICDVDSAHIDRAIVKYPHIKNAKKYDDYRKLLDTEKLDGVVVGTPDFAHAIVVVAALKRKLPVYSEKPLTKTIAELRTLLAATAEAGVPTQTGNQIHAGKNYRRSVDILRAGVIGPVRHVHIWQKSSVRALKLAKNPTVPSTLNYDLWLGPVSYRPFNPAFFHFDWRYWWDFGGGHLADFCCHYMDVPFWALELKYPTTIQAFGKKTYVGDNNMPDAMRVEYEFPARGDKPPVHLTWTQGEFNPAWTKPYNKPSAIMFEGEHGRLLVDYGTRKLFLEPGLEAHDVPQVVPDSPGHHKEWTNAIKGGPKTSSPFEYGGLLTESGLLGNVSYRAGEKKITWDAVGARVTDCPEADQYLHSEYRAGWSL